MNYQYLIVTVEDGVGIITFHRPEALNSLNSAVLNDLDHAVDELVNDESVRVIVFTGEGKSFISGADIDELADSRGLQVINYSKRGCEIFRKIELLPKPTIAAVNGYAFGGGFEFLLCCDIRIANEKASFAMPEVTLGIVPGFNGTQRLPRAIGVCQAKELLFTGRRIKADEALALGAINRVVPLDTFWQEVMAEAQTIANNSSTAIYLVKSAVNAGIDAAFDVAKEVEVGYMAACFGTEDQIEGLSSFREKRKPSYRTKK